MFLVYAHFLQPYYIFNLVQLQLYRKGIKVTVVCPGPVETSNGSGATTSGKKGSSEVSFLW